MGRNPAAAPSLLRSARRQLFRAVVAGWLRAAFGILLVVTAGWAVDAGGLATGMGVLAAILVVGRALAASAGPLLAERVATTVDLDLRRRVFNHVLALGPQVRRGAGSGQVVSKATEGVGAVGEYAGTFLPNLILGMTVPVVIAGVLAWIDPISGLVVLVMLPLVPALLRLLERRFVAVSNRYRETADQLAARFLDALQGLPTLATLARTEEVGQRLADESETLRRETMRLLAVNQLALLAVDSLFSLGTVVAAAGIASYRLSLGAVTLGEALAVTLLGALLIEPLSQIGRFFYVGAIGRAAARQVRELLALPVQPPAPQSPTLPEGEAGILLENVTFSYPDGTQALEGVSLRVAPGELVALVGPSGAGKSTLVALLLGFERAQQGRVVVAGVDPAVDPDAARRRVALVPQRPHLFLGSIADNLRLADPDAEQEQLEMAAEVAGLLAVVSALPAGFDTPVGERGADLSGGEAQRVAVARALLRNAPVVVLDEPTSNLDLASEAAVRRGIEVLSRDRAVLVIAHRFSTIASADRVVVLEGGRVVESGPPAELLRRQGLLARMAAASGVTP